jgi:xanthine/uracil permease
MAGLGAQHVVAMFGATFVFPAIMGLNPNLAVMMSGVATIIFLLIVNGKVPSYLGTSASFVAAVAAIRAQGGDSADVTGAILIAGVILAVVGVLVHFGGAKYVRAVLPPSVTGAVVMLIGFNLATVATTIYFVKDQWVGLLTTAFLLGMAVLGRGFLSRIAVFLSLIFGYLISWIADSWSTVQSCSAAGKCIAVDRIDWSGVHSAPWIGLPKTITSPTFGELTGPHLPTFNMTFILLVIPSVIALLAENSGHVKAVSEMTGDDLDPYVGRAFIGDGDRFAGRRLADDHLRGEHRRHGGDQDLLDAGLLHRGGGRDPLRVLPEVRRGRGGDAWRCARGDHARAVRHDRPARRQDLGREPGQFRGPDQPCAAGSGNYRGDR